MRRYLPWLSVIVLAILPAFTQPRVGDARKGAALTLQQQLTFETALAAYYRQAALYNYAQSQFEGSLSDAQKALRSAMWQQGAAFSNAETSVGAACPGTVVGLHDGAAKCQPK